MRLLEIILLLILLPPVIDAFVPAKRPFWINGLPLLAAVILLLHLVIEGQRWQMFPAYLLTAILGLLRLRPQSNVKKRWAIAIPLGLVGLLWWLIALALPVALPVPRLMAATGSYAVGTTTVHLVDNGRFETYADDASAKREVTVQVWYPASPGENAEKAIYLPSLDVIGPAVAQQFDLPAFLLNHVNLTKLDIFQDAPAVQSADPFPIIIFSHGLAGLRVQNTAMFQELASQGYVVAALDHTYANAISIFPDGRVFLYDEDRVFPTDEPRHVQANDLLHVWAADIGFLLDQMALWQTEEGLFNGRLDSQNVGIFGHSTGGGATIEFCLQDSRCRAGVGLDSWVLPVSKNLLTNGLSQPFMFISTPHWLGPENQALGQTIFNNLTNDGYNLTLADTGHYDFTDFVLLTPLTPQLGLSGTINSQYSLMIQNEYIVAFFDQYLRGAERAVLTRPSPYPELTIDR